MNYNVNDSFNAKLELQYYDAFLGEKHSYIFDAIYPIYV